MNREALIAQINAHEGLRLYPYQDVVGVWTIGYGHNLTARGISQVVADRLLAEDIEATLTALAGLPWYGGLSEIRQRVIADMAFNLGIDGLRRFTTMIAALVRKDYVAAAEAMLDSRWAIQVGYRSARLSRMMRTDRED